MCPYKINHKEDLAKPSRLWEMPLGRTAGSPRPGLHEARPQGPVRLRGTQRARLPSEAGSLSHQGSEKPLEVELYLSPLISGI